MNYRIFVEKREDFRVEAQNLMNDLKENVGIESLDFLRILNSAARAGSRRTP